MADAVNPVPVRPAATAILLRDGDRGIEVLMMRRNAAMDVHGDAWVFPGGRVDVADGSDAVPELERARAAAVREVVEEVGIDLAAAELVPFSHWTTPVVMPKRFATWFFVTAVPGDVTFSPDGHEAVDARWFAPLDALAFADARGTNLAPPQFVTLTELAPYRSVAAVLDAAQSREVRRYLPRVVGQGGGTFTTVYEGDVAYAADADLAAPGPRHRLVVERDTWRYERDPSL